MTLYLDTSVIVSLLVPDDFSASADALVRRSRAGILVSDFAAAECASAVARLVRTRSRTKPEAQALFADLDLWLQVVERVEISNSDIVAAGIAIRRLDLTLRTADAIHIAAASRFKAELATFDRRMAESAQTLGVAVVPN